VPTVEYTKKRSIASGSADDPEVLEFNAIDITQFDRIQRDELMTMGKAVSSVLQNILQGWRVHVKVNYSDLDSWREFLHSVANRESFLFDPTGTEASPGTQYTVTMSTPSINYSRTKPSYMDITMEFEETAP
jgi:phage-related protein